LQRHVNFHGHYSFRDRSSGAKQLVMVLAGYKPFLWEWTLDRVARFVPAGSDVCLVSPGLHSADLDDLASRCGWSYLAASERNIPLAQNLAIQAHQAAAWIYKLDEDVFVEAGFFEGLRSGYEQIKAEREYQLSMCSPIVNVNGFSYVDFLRALGLEDAYRERFGAPTRAGDGIPAWYDGEVAVWLWERSLPLDETAAFFAARPFGYSAVPHRLNIGAILYERELWETLGGLRVSFPARIRTGLGDDEAYLCSSAISHSRVACVLHNVFAAHFGFAPQYLAMRRAFPAMQARLSSADPTHRSGTGPQTGAGIAEPPDSGWWRR